MSAFELEVCATESAAGDNVFFSSEEVLCFLQSMCQEGHSNIDLSESSMQQYVSQVLSQFQTRLQQSQSQLQQRDLTDFFVVDTT